MGAVTDVEATLTGQAIELMKCELNGMATICTWPEEPVITGTYSLEVKAPGFQTTNVSAKITVAPDTCGCTEATMQPSKLTLDPS
jgi:hypothetical protein